MDVHVVTKADHQAHYRIAITPEFTDQDTAGVIIDFLVWKIRIGDLVDAKDDRCWFVAIVIDILKEMVYVHYIGYHFKERRWIHQASIDIMPIGTYTAGTAIATYTAGPASPIFSCF